MTTIVGLIVVFAAVLGGFAMAGGPFPVLIQPNEFVVLVGAVIGTLIISAPGKAGKRIIAAMKKAFTAKAPTQSDYTELLKCLYSLFQVMRRDGVLALEQHLADPHKSSIFSKYPGILKDHHVVDFLVDSLRQLVDGCSPEDLMLLFDADLETMHEEEHQPVSLIRTAGDALPGLGIVAAVLGIVITMSHLDGGPEEIGHHVAAALVGTFLGILLCYGVIGPIATAIEQTGVAHHRYLLCIKDGILAAARGNTPELAVEFARRSIYTDERPSSKDMEAAFKSLKSGG
ncbi:MAG: flagellar motor stator protein MotA [Sandaracinus sp.]